MGGCEGECVGEGEMYGCEGRCVGLEGAVVGVRECGNVRGNEWV